MQFAVNLIAHKGKKMKKVAIQVCLYLCLEQLDYRSNLVLALLLPQYSFHIFNTKYKDNCRKNCATLHC